MTHEAEPGAVEKPAGRKGKELSLWFWAAIMLPVLAVAAGVWFFTGTEAGRLLRLDWQYRNKLFPERLPVSSQPPSNTWGSKGVMTVHVRRDGQYVMNQEVDLGRLETEFRDWAAQSFDADGLPATSVRIVGDRRCRASQVVKVIEAARRCGIQRFTLLAMSSQPPAPNESRSYVQIHLWYTGRATDVEEVLPASDWSVQDLVRELDRFESAGVTNYCVGKYKLD